MNDNSKTNDGTNDNAAEVTQEKLSEEELNRRFIEQQSRRACPGCGESP